MVGELLFASRIDGSQLKWDVMGKENSFDIVSVIEMHEVDNAINQAKKEAANRYDLKKSSCVIDFEKTANQMTLSAENDLALKSLYDILTAKLVRRGVDIKSLSLDEVRPASGGHVRREGRFVQGISNEKGKEIAKALKQTKLKINVQIQPDQVRVAGKKKDVLQEAIGFIKSKDFGLPLQITNFR